MSRWKTLLVPTSGIGLYEITEQVAGAYEDISAQQACSHCSVFIQHTSASLLIQENADSTAKHDLEAWFSAIVQKAEVIFWHTAEGVDDMPAHVKAALTQTFLIIPCADSQLLLGRWQGIYLFEHRRTPHKRTIIISGF